MKQIVLMIAVVALVGGCVTTPENPDTKPTPTPAPAKPQPTPAPIKAQPTRANIVPADLQNNIIEKKIRKPGYLNKPTGELTKADYEKVTKLDLGWNQLTEVPKGLENLTQLRGLRLNKNQLTDVKGLEKLTKLTWLYLNNNQLTSVKGLEKLTKLKRLYLHYNPDLTFAQIVELSKRCRIVVSRTAPRSKIRLRRKLFPPQKKTGVVYIA